MLEPQLAQAIQKTVRKREQEEEPRGWVRYLKNLWQAILGQKNVVVVQVYRMPDFSTFLDQIMGENVHQKEDGLEVFKHAFSQNDHG